MKDLFFTVDARALITLGRESIKDHTTALVELVKNSYDADATIVDVELITTAPPKENFVRVADNGEGMTDDDIRDKWLRIGFSSKRKDRVTDSRRRRTGEKGIGRLSADRLGRYLELRTIAQRKAAVGLRVDWDQFQRDGKELTEIPLAALSEATPTIPSLITRSGARNGTGTELKIFGLRQQWSADDVRALHNELSTLTPPFREAKVDFKIRLKSDVVPDLDGIVRSNFVEAAELHLIAEFDGKENLKYSISDRLDRRRKHPRKIQGRMKLGRLFQESGLGSGRRAASPGACSIQLMFFPRKAATLESTGLSMGALRQFLDTNAGIRIYRDNIRVKPYGDPTASEGDWLGLAERKTRSPAGPAREDFRMAPNQLVGAVFVTRDGNADLQDSSSREGLVHGDAFNALRKLVLGSVFLLEARYHKLFVQELSREKEKKKVQRARERIRGLRSELRVLAEGLKKIRQEMPEEVSDDVELSLERIESVLGGIAETSRSLEELASESTIYRGLATLGIASAVFGHETQTSISGLLGSLHLVHRLLERTPPRAEAAATEAEKALAFAQKVGSWGRFALLRVKRDKRRRQRVAVKDIIHSVVEELRPVFEAASISVSAELRDVEARTFPMDLESVLINLLTNAYSACQQTGGARRIKVSLKPHRRDSKDGFEISVADSGPGVSKRYVEQIWEPLFSTKVDDKGRALGTGLGLTIVKSTVDELGGKAIYERDAELGGAKFIVWVPMR